MSHKKINKSGKSKKSTMLEGVDLTNLLSELLKCGSILDSNKFKGVISSSLQRKLKKVKLKFITFVISNTLHEESFKEDGKLLIIKDRCGEDYYDILNSVLSTYSYYVQKRKLDKLDSHLASLYGMLERFTSTYSELEYNRFLRNFVLNVMGLDSGLYTAINMLHLLIVEWYNRGLQVSGDSDLRVSACKLVDASLIELLILDYRIWVSSEQTPDFVISKEDVHTVHAVLAQLNGDSKIEQLEAFLGLDGNSDFLDLFSLCFHSAFICLFSTNVEPNNAIHSLAFKSIDKTIDKTQAVFASVTDSLLEAVGTDILVHRQILVREKGVAIRLQKTLFNISRIELYEVHKSGMHYIFLQYSLCDRFTRYLVLNIEDLTKTIYSFECNSDFIVLFGMFKWLGLYPLVEKVLSYESENLSNNVKSCISELFAEIVPYFEEGNLHYETPVHWNYQNSHSNNLFIRSIDTTQAPAAYAQKLISVGSYVRKLPSGASASMEAKDLAAKYKLELEDGFTFVNGFTRKQTVKLAAFSK